MTDQADRGTFVHTSQQFLRGLFRSRAKDTDDGIAGSKSSLTWAVNLSVVLLVALWLFPTVGLLVSSFRTADQISSSGWWNALFPTEQNLTLRTAAPDTRGRPAAMKTTCWQTSASRWL